MNTEKQYIAAFNNGYLLAEHEPKLLHAITQTLNPKNNYLEGLFAGKGQFEHERDNMQLLAIESLRGQSKDRNRELGRG